jgi:hypothetical protein
VLGLPDNVNHVSSRAQHGFKQTYLWRPHVVQPLAHGPFVLGVHGRSAGFVAGGVVGLVHHAHGNLHHDADVVLFLVHALDHRDLVDYVVGADEQLGFLLDGVGEDVDGFAEVGFELLVAFCDLPGLLAMSEAGPFGRVVVMRLA